MNNKFAFTLAEVLITLGVIGVVAAMTIPTLIQKQNEKEIITRLKKAYSVLSQAYTMTVAEYGTPDNWGLDRFSVEIPRTYLSKYMKGEKCDSTFKCYGKEPIKMNLSKTIDNGVDLKSSPSYILNDGTIIEFGHILSANCSGLYDECSDVLVIFPNKKGEIRRGVNEFMFMLTKNGFIPYGKASSSTFSFETDCSLTANGRNNGHGCTAWVLYNENMDYLHCNDLAWNGKVRCK